MAKAKGSEKTGGRKKGTPNKVSADVRSAVADIVSGHLDMVAHDLRLLAPKERIDVVVKLLPFVIPKQTDIDASVTALPESSGEMIIGFLDCADEDE